ncbi:MAG: WG repeat-containing protein [Bacteroidia bacterium]|nr:WG repeat-containing protein [Bacteroidia bacterium]
MKSLSGLLFLLLFSLQALSQSVPFKVGEKWKFEHPNVSENGNSYGKFLFNEGLCAVIYHRKVGFIDSAQTIVIPFDFLAEGSSSSYSYPFANGRVIVYNGTNWGVIDKTGKTVVPFLYQGLQRFEHYYYFYQNDHNGYLDSAGKVVIESEYEWPTAPYRTDEKIEQQILLNQQQLALESQAGISRKQAIRIAKSKGCYHDDAWPFTPHVALDPVKNQWVISSTKDGGMTRAGDCAHTNGCIVHFQYQIVIDSQNGKVKEKTMEKHLIPVYE